MMEKKPNEKFLRQVFGFDSFRPNQKLIIEAILSGRDVFAVMPTGGGKSLCYQYPAMILDGVCVVVSPLLSLMKDQVDAARETGIRAATLNSSTNRRETVEILQALENGQLDLLYVSPERFNTSGFLERLVTVKLAFFAIDEAHCISEWGHQFRPDYLALRQIVEVFPNTSIAAFTATATAQVANDIQQQLQLRNPFCVRASFDRPNLNYRIVYKDDLNSQLVDFLENVPEQAGIIYRATRKKVEETSEMLTKKGFNVRPYHAGMSDVKRIQVQDAFSQDQIQIIVATVAFGMGIDKSNVRFVVHADLPKNLEGYYQETGRAGRDGSPSECVLFFGYQDWAIHKTLIEKYDEPEVQEVALRQLQEMVQFAETDQCRRKALLRYFGEDYPSGNCGHCDFCNEKIQRVDVSVDAQKALSAMQRTGNRFGIEHLIGILRGSKTAKIKQFQHDQLPTYGVGSDKGRQYWRFLINTLIRKGAAFLDSNSEFPVPKVSELGWEIMRGKEHVEMAQFPEFKKRKTNSRLRRAPIDLNLNDPELFEQLRQRRREIAQERHVPPYVIFTDKTLIEMSNHKPRSNSAMLEINGVGERKMASYGETFLNLIVAYVTSTNDDSQSDPNDEE